MEEAIAICKPGVPYREVGNVIESVTKPKGYGIVRRYTAHGVHRLVSTSASASASASAGDSACMRVAPELASA
jgi:methionine aminopeptidase